MARNERQEKKGRGARAKRTGADELPGKPPFFGFEKIPLATEEELHEPAAVFHPAKVETTIEVSSGSLVVENYCSPERLEALSVDPGIFMFSRNDLERQKRALIHVSRSEGGNVVTATMGDALVGYIGIHHPSESERWGKPGYPWLFELGAIEVSRNFRESGMSMAMMHAAWDDQFYEDKVVLTTAFTWHWDLEATGMTTLEYRELFIELAGRFGFMEMATDEPNVMMDAANLFLVRLGRNTSFSQYQKFASLLFTNEWEAMLRGF